MNKNHTVILSVIAIMNLVSALLIINFGGNLNIGYFNLFTACVLATLVGLKGQ